jgi:O-antigen/teichoic acid export membrane protein
MPLFFGLIGIADIFVPLFFGPGYDKAVILIRILSGLFIAIGLNTVIGAQYLIPLKKERVFTVTVLCGAFINLILNIFLINRYQSIGAAISSVVAESIIAIAQFAYIRNNFNIKRIFLGSFRNIISSLIMMTVLYTMKSFMLINILSMLLMIFVCCIAYVIFLLIMQDKFLLLLVNSIIKKK